MKIKSEIILPHLYLLTFETQYELCMSFVRIQEFYESPKFRNKYFTLEEFIDYWAKEFGNGSFDYPARWNGFNLPSKVISKWYTLASDCGFIRNKEGDLLETIGDLVCKEYEEDNILGSAKYYVIGINNEHSEEKKKVIDHETAHALYYLYPSYKKAVNKLLKDLPKDISDVAAKHLLKIGYGKNVSRDEMQAYFSTNDIGEVCPIRPLGRIEKFAKNLNDFREKLVK